MDVSTLASPDAITGLGSRAALDGRLHAECARSERYGCPLSLCMLELGGPALDEPDHELDEEVLREVAVLLGHARVADQAFRVDARTFAIAMPETTAAGARTAARRLGAAIELAGIGDGRLEVSWGVADVAEGAHELVEAATLELRRAQTARA